MTASKGHISDYFTDNWTHFKTMSAAATGNGKAFDFGVSVNPVMPIQCICIATKPAIHNGVFSQAGDLTGQEGVKHLGMLSRYLS